MKKLLVLISLIFCLFAITSYANANDDSRINKDAQVHYNLGKVYIERKQFDEAIKEFKEAIKLESKYARAHSDLGNAYSGKGLFDQAIAEYKEAIRINPQEGDFHYNLGSVYSGKGLFDQAIAEYKEAIRINPQNGDYHFNLAHSYKKKGLFNESVTEFKEAIRINPNEAEAYYSMGKAYENIGLIEEALNSYKEAVKINPKDADYYLNLGAMYMKKDSFEEALTSLKEASKIEPNDPQAYHGIGLIYEEKREYGLARTYLKKALSLATEEKDKEILRESLYKMGQEELESLQRNNKVEEETVRVKDSSEDGTPVVVRILLGLFFLAFSAVCFIRLFKIIKEKKTVSLEKINSGVLEESKNIGFKVLGQEKSKKFLLILGIIIMFLGIFGIFQKTETVNLSGVKGLGSGYGYGNRRYVDRKLDGEERSKNLSYGITFFVLGLGMVIWWAIKNKKGRNEIKLKTFQSTDKVNLSDKEIDELVLVEYEYEKREGGAGCLAFSMIILGLFLFIVPVVGWIAGFICIGFGIKTMTSPVRSIMSPGSDKYETFKKQVRLRLERGQLLSIKCPVCNGINQIRPDTYYQNRAFHCSLCNQDSKRELFVRIGW